MDFNAANEQLDKTLDKPSHKLLVKILILFVIGFCVVFYFAVKFMVKVSDDKYNSKSAESEEWRKLYIDEAADHKRTIRETRKYIRDSRTEYDTIVSLIEKPR